MTQINSSNNGTLSVMEAIQARRTIFKFKPDPVPKNILEDILYAGIWAPNHHLTEPWRFTILGEKVKLTLADRYGEIQIEKVTSNPAAAKAATEENLAEIGARGVQKFMSKPTIVAVSCIKEGNTQRQLEDYASTCCAMLNIQLAGWEQGIGMQWSTGGNYIGKWNLQSARYQSRKRVHHRFLLHGLSRGNPDPEAETAASSTPMGRLSQSFRKMRGSLSGFIADSGQ